MVLANQCPECGSEFDPAVGQMCPRCLLGAAKVEKDPHMQPTINHEAAAAPPKPMDIQSLFPELEIVDVIGQGGMGYVYRARQRNLGREVALKILSPSLRDDPAFEERFSREARAMAMMNHPNIIAIHDFGQRGKYFFLTMELVDGLNLRQLVQNTKLQPQEAMQLIPQLCDALQYAHDRGVVHRDIKPENILLSQDGQIKIADFGLAKLTGNTQNLTLTHTQQVMGTLNYMAPEQRERPMEVDHRADIYSLGVVIYEMLTGELPLGRFAPPSQKVQVDVRLDEIVLRALEKDPTLRFQHANDFKTGVQSLVSHGPIASTPFSTNFNKIGQLFYVGLALMFCIGGVLLIVLSGLKFENEWLSETHLRTGGFFLIFTGAFLFAMWGFYLSIFDPDSKKKDQGKDIGESISDAIEGVEKAVESTKDTTPHSPLGMGLRIGGMFCFFAAGAVFMGSTSLAGEYLDRSTSRFVALAIVIFGAFLFAISGMIHEETKKLYKGQK